MIMSPKGAILSLVEEIHSSTRLLTASVDVDDDARVRALEAARKLTAALATPTETILHHSYEVLHPQLVNPADQRYRIDRFHR